MNALPVIIFILLVFIGISGLPQLPFHASPIAENISINATVFPAIGLFSLLIMIAIIFTKLTWRVFRLFGLAPVDPIWRRHLNRLFFVNLLVFLIFGGLSIPHLMDTFPLGFEHTGNFIKISID